MMHIAPVLDPDFDDYFEAADPGDDVRMFGVVGVASDTSPRFTHPAIPMMPRPRAKPWICRAQSAFEAYYDPWPAVGRMMRLVGSQTFPGLVVEINGMSRPGRLDFEHDGRMYDISVDLCARVESA